MLAKGVFFATLASLSKQIDGVIRLVTIEAKTTALKDSLRQKRENAAARGTELFDRMRERQQPVPAFDESIVAQVKDIASSWQGLETASAGASNAAMPYTKMVFAKSRIAM